VERIWVPAAASAVAEEPAVNESAVADDDPDEVGSDGGSNATTAVSTIVGDSLHSDDDDAAAAADGSDNPRHKRDTRPPDVKPATSPPAWSALRNDAEHVGNVGWLFWELGEAAP